MTKREREGFKELMSFHCGGKRGVVEAAKVVPCFVCFKRSPGLMIDMSEGTYFAFTVCYPCLDEFVRKGRSYAS